jgi:bacterioferritin-associated ferredoxin
MQDSCVTHSCDACPVRVVCRCLKVTEAALVEALATHDLRTLKDVGRHTGAGDGCTACHRELAAYLQGYASSAVPSARSGSSPP